ncbi:DUF5134 domain-containing protein [Saccharomonospora sp. NPDC006951]
MIASPVLSWLLSLLFAATAAWCVRVLLLPSTRVPARIDTGWHLLMSVAMIAMIWPWGMAVPAAAQAVVFTVAAGWFLGRMFLAAGHSGEHHAPRAACTHHAVMMAGMAWMAASMPALMSNSGHDSGGGGHHHAMGGGGTPMAQAAHDTVGATPVALTISCLALGLVFVALCLPWLARAFDLGRRLPDQRFPALGRVVADHTCHALMSFGMGVMFLAVA